MELLSQTSVRKIIHIDMDAFYASVEQRDKPELRGRPIAVGGSPEGRGVVAAASYEARRFGVRSAMSARRAAKLCPELIFVSPDFERYKAASRLIRSVFHEVTDRVEPLALDEAYLDVTVNKLEEPFATKVAKHVKARIREQSGLTASAGVGPNKFLAKLACEWRKPDGLYVIPPERAIAFLDPLDVEKLWGVGPSTARKLRDMKLSTIRDVRECDPAKLVKRLGRFGLFLQGLSRGEDPRPVEVDRPARSRGAETTFGSDLESAAALASPLKELCAEIFRSQRSGRTVTLKLRYGNFQTITRSRTIPGLVKDADELEAIAWELLQKTEAGRRSVRLLGVSLSGFEEPNLDQLPLF